MYQGSTPVPFCPVIGTDYAFLLFICSSEVSHFSSCLCVALDVISIISVNPNNRVKVKVNKMTSHQTLLPLQYYSLPLCKPQKGPPTWDHLNLGEVLAGDRIASSPYLVVMKQDLYCEQVCIQTLGPTEERGVPPNRVVQAIRQEYVSRSEGSTKTAASCLMILFRFLVGCVSIGTTTIGLSTIFRRPIIGARKKTTKDLLMILPGTRRGFPWDLFPKRMIRPTFTIM